MTLRANQRQRMVDSSLRCNFEECEPQAPKARNMLARASASEAKHDAPGSMRQRPQALKVRNRNPLNPRAKSLLQSSVQFGAAPGAARFAIAQHFHPSAAAAPGTPACPWLPYSAPLALNPKPAALMRVALPN